MHDSRGQSSVWTLDNCGYLHGALPPKTAKTGRKKHRNVSELHMLPQTSWTKDGLCCGTNCPPYTHNISTKSLSTVSTISSNYHPPLIDMNNNRRKLVNGEHNCPRQKGQTPQITLYSRSEQKATSGLQPVSWERYFTIDIHLPPESHFITGSPTDARSST